MIVVPARSGDGAADNGAGGGAARPGGQSGPGGAGQVVAFRRLLEPRDPRAALGDPAIQDGETLEFLARAFAVVLLDYAAVSPPARSRTWRRDISCRRSCAAITAGSIADAAGTRKIVLCVARPFS